MQKLTHYDPRVEPDPDEWLHLDEAKRIALVRRYHHDARIRLPNARLHSTIHVIVENQLALGESLPVRRIVRKLQSEGLDRHEAIHAVGSALLKHLTDLLQGGPPSADPHAGYWADLDDLDAEDWRLNRDVVERPSRSRGRRRRR